MTEAWTTDEVGNSVSIYVNDELIKCVESATPQIVKTVAAENQLRKFTVTGDDGRPLSTADFPVTTGSVHIDEYNEAK